MGAETGTLTIMLSDITNMENMINVLNNETASSTQVSNKEIMNRIKTLLSLYSQKIILFKSIGKKTFFVSC